MVTFWTTASEIDVGNQQFHVTGGNAQVYAYDLVLGALEPVSTNSDGTYFNGNSGALTPTTDGSGNVTAHDAWASSLSADGRYVAFQSQLADRDFSDIFVKDLQTGAVQQVSLTAGGGEPDGSSIRPDISPDGRYVIYTSAADDIGSGSSNGQPNAFLYDTQTQTTTLVSQSVINELANGDSSWGEATSAAGVYAAFGSTATNLTGDSSNGFANVYLVDNSGGTSGVVVEEENATMLAAGGTIAFSDPDPQDGHNLAWTLESVVDSQGNQISQALAHALTQDFNNPSIIDDSAGTGTGYVQWTFTGNETDFAGLQFGENLQVTYQLVLSDDDGGSQTTQDVNITIIGTPAPPHITGGATTGAVADGGQTLATGQLTATDADNNDTLTWSIDGGHTANGSDSVLVGQYGTLDLKQDGTWTFELAEGQANLEELQADQIAHDLFTVLVTDFDRVVRHAHHRRRSHWN